MLPSLYLPLVSMRPNRNLNLYVYPTLVKRNEVVGGESGLHYTSIFSPSISGVKLEGELSFLPCNNKVLLITFKSTHHLYPHSKVMRWCMLGGCHYFCQKIINHLLLLEWCQWSPTRS